MNKKKRNIVVGIVVIVALFFLIRNPPLLTFVCSGSHYQGSISLIEDNIKFSKYKISFFPEPGYACVEGRGCETKNYKKFTFDVRGTGEGAVSRYGVKCPKEIMKYDGEFHTGWVNVDNIRITKTPTIRTNPCTALPQEEIPSIVKDVKAKCRLACNNFGVVGVFECLGEGEFIAPEGIEGYFHGSFEGDLEVSFYKLGYEFFVTLIGLNLFLV